MGSLSVLRIDASPCDLASRSRAWARTWEREERADAVLLVGVPTAEAAVLGAFQRRSEIVSDVPTYVVVRGSGGGVAQVGPGSVWVQLALARPDALVACTADKLLNRYVRPLLRAMTRTASIPASYFGRDWISCAHHPVALVAFAHDAATGRSLFEAIVAVSTPLAVATRASFLSKQPATLEEVAGRSLDPSSVADAIASGYRGISDATSDPEPSVATDAEEFAPIEPPWSASRDEVMGTIRAGRDAAGRLRVGGELMASGDAMLRLEELVAALPPHARADEIGGAVDDALTARGAVTFGVRSLASIRDVIFEALRGA